MSTIHGLGLNAGLIMGANALNVQQVAIETIGNNISNINTPGYARQRANIVTNSQDGIGGEMANGSTLSNIESLRSPLLDTLVQQSLGDQGFADNQASLTSTVQDSLGEQFTSAGGSTTSGTVTSGSGPVQDALTNFFGALQSLASSPTDPTARQVVVTDAQTLADAINSAGTRVQSTQAQIGTDASTLTTQINQLSTSIAALNQQITQTEAASGGSANNLRDTRTADIEKLSGLVNVTTSTNANGSINVALADAPSVVLVNDTFGGGATGSQSLSATYSASGNPPLTISGSTSGSLGTGIPSSGTLGSDLDVANNVIGSPASSGNTGLLGALDGVASQLISQMNTANAAGFDLNGNGGGTFFSGTGASSIAVSAAIVANPSLIAAGNGTGPLDGSNAQAMASLQTQPGIIPALQTMVSGLGQTVSTAASNQGTQDAVTKQLQTQRDSVSGVSIDEEMTNLINFQNAYSASARFITTLSSLYDTLTSIPTS